MIKDKKGNTVLEQECEGGIVWDVPSGFDKGVITITLNGNGVVKLCNE